MRSGSLNRLVRVEHPVPVLDDAGQPLYDDAGQAIVEWVLFDDLWANILDKSGKQFIASAAEVSEVMTSIRIRYRTDVTAAMRVVHGSVLYEIRAVLPDEVGRDRTDLVCVTGANQG